MGKLDVSVLRYLGADEFRIMMAIEKGMKNHEYVPSHVVGGLAGLRRGGSHKVLKELVRHKLVGYDNKKAEGYRLTTAGFDFLALRTLSNRESLHGVGNQIGVGKESDIFIVANKDGLQHALKLHRLGRNSFRTIKKNRDYMKNRKHTSWLYLAKLAALKEYAYMRALYDAGFPVPVPVDCDRNCIVMQLLDATPMSRVQEIDKPGVIYNELMELIVKLANHGLIHCDFNEFNLMISKTGKVTMIDFPQMVSTEHENAEWYFDRDVACIRTYFTKRFNYTSTRYPKFKDVVRGEKTLDKQVAASGFSRDQQRELAEFQVLDKAAEEGGGDDETSSSEDESEDEDDGVADATAKFPIESNPNGNDARSAEAAIPDSGAGPAEPDEFGNDPILSLAEPKVFITVQVEADMAAAAAAAAAAEVAVTRDGGEAEADGDTELHSKADAADTDAAVGPASQLAEKSAAAGVPKVAVTGGDAGDKGTEGLGGKAGDEGNEGDEDEGEEEEEDIDAALDAEYATNNRQRRAFRDDNTTLAPVRPTPKPTITKEDIRDKVKRAMAGKSNRKKGKVEKGTVSRENKAKKGKTAQRANAGW